MLYTIGYQMREDDDLLSAILRHRASIYEVYFSFADIPNGRGAMEERVHRMPHEAQAKQLADLSRLSACGIGMNLLLNGNCYGKDAESRAFFERIGETIDHLVRTLSLASVTTTSPLIARFVKENFPDVKTRASVNMEIGSVSGMDYLADLFDGFYMKREYNRDMARIRTLDRYCRENGKQLFMLANSGCLADCSSHIFHDNLVAHEKEISAMDNAYDFRGTCWDYIKKPQKRVSLIRDTTYVRPEDMGLYEGYFTAAKLATRVNFSPARVLEAYIGGRYVGSTLDLLEPNFSGGIYPHYLDNQRFPDGFAVRVANCGRQCDTCHYCDEVYEKTVINLEETIC